MPRPARLLRDKTQKLNRKSDGLRLFLFFFCTRIKQVFIGKLGIATYIKLPIQSPTVPPITPTNNIIINRKLASRLAKNDTSLFLYDFIKISSSQSISPFSDITCSLTVVSSQNLNSTSSPVVRSFKPFKKYDLPSIVHASSYLSSELIL